MRALVVDQGRVSHRTDRPEAAPAEGEVNVAVHLAGICATDLEIQAGYMGFAGVPGHEFVGVARGGRLAGRRVVGEINAACGRCDRCARGMDRHCADRTVLGIVGRDGAFAESLSLPERNLHALPDAISDESAVFVEPLAAAFAIFEQVEIPAGTRVAVLGDGKLGLLCALALASRGARVSITGRHDRKLAIARRAGAEVLASDAKGSFPVVVEATGSGAGLARALELVEPRGTIVLKTTTHAAPPESLARLVVDEVRVVGSRCGRFGPAIEALASGRIDPRPLVDDRFALARGAEAFARAAAPGTLKVLLEVA
ncbi:MAG TPA: alcohol dehydrogenase catalytic domain-containing protein [Planctomycetota bacterium]|nr:alcohol dehydrogenase catalytic domain-containing protein [Planctomycetota bacterium]